MPAITEKKILVPVDFSEQSLMAVEHACILAHYCEASIVMLHVKEDQSGIKKLLKGKKETAQDVEKKLSDLVEDISCRSALKGEFIIEKGDVADAILNTAKNRGIIYVVMGFNGSRGLRKKILGDNTIKIIRQCPVPVVTVKHNCTITKYGTIILPLDLTKETTQKVSKAIELAKVYKDTRIKVISVLFSVEEFVVNKLTRQMEEVRQQIEEAGVICSAEIIKTVKGEETQAQVIIDYANKIEADLIMVMAQPEAGIREYIVDDDVTEIINDSDIPVLSIVPERGA